MAEPITVTPELLQLAWQDRRRAHWPATFDACMADDMLRRLVRAEAVRLALALRGRARRADLLQATPPMRPFQPRHACARRPCAT